MNLEVQESEEILGEVDKCRHELVPNSIYLPHFDSKGRVSFQRTYVGLKDEFYLNTVAQIRRSHTTHHDQLSFIT